MIFSGKVLKKGKYWIVEIPALEHMTQARLTKRKARILAKVLIEEASRVI